MPAVSPESRRVPLASPTAARPGASAHRWACLLAALVALPGSSAAAPALDVMGRPDSAVGTPAGAHTYSSEPRVERVRILNEDDGYTFRATLIYPADLDESLPSAAIVLIHGLGTWEEQRLRWEPMAWELARQGYVALYPDVRYLGSVNGPGDCLYAARWLREAAELGVERIGVVGGSAGNLVATSVAQLHADEFDAFVDLYGVVGDDTWGHGEAEHIAAMSTPMLTQVGEDDSWILQRNRQFDRSIAEHNPELPHHTRVYADAVHGFFFMNTPSGERARRDHIQFLDWTLKDAPRPHWFVW